MPFRLNGVPSELMGVSSRLIGVSSRLFGMSSRFSGVSSRLIGMVPMFCVFVFTQQDEVDELDGESMETNSYEGVVRAVMRYLVP
ncbi:hypothetical protein Btru_075934 [Bulinus truncatus]|nr:hypothetical protein Btru_075934 [Bulinus truncatus]